MKKIYVLLFAAVLVVGSLLLYEPPRDETTPETVETAQADVTVSVSIETDYQKNIVLAPPVSVLEVLEYINAEDPALKLHTTNYEGMGVLVDSMYEKSNGSDNRYWQYRVNGVTPLLSADALELKDGDYLEWVFEPSTF